MFESVFRATGRLEREPEGLEIGNGVEIELKVHSKASKYGISPPEADLVALHFLPQLSSGERAGHPREVPPHEKKKIKTDAIEGMILLAHKLANQEIPISGLSDYNNFVLFISTNIGLALFLKQVCGFEGEYRTGVVWMKASDFYSEANITRMTQELEKE